MKFKLQLLTIATVVGLTACGGENKSDVSKVSVADVVKSQEATLKKNLPEVVEEEKEPELDWEAPTERYYTMGLSPLDPSALINRYKIDEKTQNDTVWISTDKTTLGYLSARDGNGTLYRHENLSDYPEKVKEEQVDSISSLLAIEKAMAENCKKLTERMSFQLEQENFSQLVVILKTVGGKQLQSWFFQHNEEGYYLISQRHIAEPKGYISRCKDAFDEAVIKPALTSTIYQF